MTVLGQNKGPHVSYPQRWWRADAERSVFEWDNQAIKFSQNILLAFNILMLKDFSSKINTILLNNPYGIALIYPIVFWTYVNVTITTCYGKQIIAQLSIMNRCSSFCLSCLSLLTVSSNLCHVSLVQDDCTLYIHSQCFSTFFIKDEILVYPFIICWKWFHFLDHPCCNSELF